MIFQYKGFNFKIDFEDKSIFSLIIENKKLYSFRLSPPPPFFYTEIGKSPFYTSQNSHKSVQ